MSLVSAVATFARLLHELDVPVGPERTMHALRALDAVGVERRDDVKAALRCVLVGREEHRAPYDAAFDWFWRTRTPEIEPEPGHDRADHAREEDAMRSRIAAAWARMHDVPPPSALPEDEIRPDAAGSASAVERLRTLDFQRMSAEELAEVRRHIAQLRLALRPLPTRRLRPDPRGRRVDLRATLRAAVRTGGASIVLCRRGPRRRVPPVVVICDISGSMRSYSMVLLHLVHTLARDLDRVGAFVFGTRLTDITRRLAHRDPDAALRGVADVVEDFAGGTRIGACLREFNVRWARRVLGQNATVILITDGLERDDPEGLAAEAQRLRRSCRRVFWLNPLLRYDGFAPTARGMRALLPQTDGLLPAHNLASLEALAGILAAP